MTEYFACQGLECSHLEESDLLYCEQVRHCPFAHQRRREEDRTDQQRRDREVVA